MDDASKFKSFLRDKLRIQPWKIAISRDCDLLDEFGEVYQRYVNEGVEQSQELSVDSKDVGTSGTQSAEVISSPGDKPRQQILDKPVTANTNTVEEKAPNETDPIRALHAKDCENCVLKNVQHFDVQTLFLEPFVSASKLEHFCNERDLRRAVLTEVFSEQEWREISKHVTLDMNQILTLRRANIALYLRYILTARHSIEQIGHIDMVHQKTRHLESLLKEIEDTF